jgi:mono/diheme cytochrome c family protein
VKFFFLIFTVSFFVFPVAEVSAGQGLRSFGRYLFSISMHPTVLVIASGICPQLRKTKKAPSKYVLKKNPLYATSKNIERGKSLYQTEAKPTACKMCHGIRGNGNGLLARGLEPAPRNFTCEETMKSLSDGQLFWVIKSGSKGTAMPAHKFTLSDKDIWQIIHYLKRFAY